MLCVLTICGDSWGIVGFHVLPPLFKRAHPHALTVISDSVADRVRCHSYTISVGTSGEVGAFRVRVAGCFALHSNTGVTNPFHSPHYVFIWPCLPRPSSVSGSIPLLFHYPC